MFYECTAVQSPWQIGYSIMAFHWYGDSNPRALLCRAVFQIAAVCACVRVYVLFSFLFQGHFLSQVKSQLREADSLQARLSMEVVSLREEARKHRVSVQGTRLS